MSREERTAPLLRTIIRVLCIRVSNLAKRGIIFAKRGIIFEFDNAAVMKHLTFDLEASPFFSQNGAVRDRASFAVVARRG
jgi:hypothetical protein